MDSLGVHFSFNGDSAVRTEVLELLKLAISTVERALEPFGARAHWGKLANLTVAPEKVKELYGEKLEKFIALCEAHDPGGKFRNSHVSRILGYTIPAASV